MSGINISSGSRRTYRLVVERADEGVPIAILGSRDWSFRLDDRVDTADYGRISDLIRRKAEMKGRAAQAHLPLWATSVAISKRTWFLTSLAGLSSSLILAVCPDNDCWGVSSVRVISGAGPDIAANGIANVGRWTTIGVEAKVLLATKRTRGQVYDDILEFCLSLKLATLVSSRSKQCVACRRKPEAYIHYSKGT